MSRHEPHWRQMEALRKMFGEDTLVELEPRPFDNARAIARRYRDGKFDDIVVVAPLSVIQALCNEGLRMLWSESEEESEPSMVDFRGGGGQGLRFLRFRRIKRGSTTTDPARKDSPALPVYGATSVPLIAGVPDSLSEYPTTTSAGSPQSSTPLPFTTRRGARAGRAARAWVRGWRAGRRVVARLAGLAAVPVVLRAEETSAADRKMLQLDENDGELRKELPLYDPGAGGDTSRRFRTSRAS